jgi:transposase-like protein
VSEALYHEAKFNDEEAARAHLESIRWPSGPVCPHCGGTERNSLLQGKSHRPGLYFCGDCRDPFTVTVGTVFERSKIGLHKWLLAMQLMCSSKKGMSSHQLHRTLGVTYKTAWFMSHRIREAMRIGSLSVPFGANGGNVEVDETYIGRDPDKKKGKRGPGHKNKVLSLVDRDSGQSYSMVIENIDWETVKPILQENISHEARILTDEAGHYNRTRVYFAGHETVNHSAEEYVRLSDRTVHTNTVEGYFSIFKRGMKGVYQHCGKQHLHRYLAEFDFRYNNRARLGVTDAQRADIALKGISGKRLTYQGPRGTRQAPQGPRALQS